MDTNAPRSPLSPLRANTIASERAALGGREKSASKLARRVKTPHTKKTKASATKNVVNFSLQSPKYSKEQGCEPASGNFFKLTLAQTPGSAKKKKEEHLRKMRAQALNKAARCESMGDYKGASDALFEEGENSAKGVNVDAVRSLKKRLSVQASLRKGRKGKQLEAICTKLDDALKKEEEANAAKNLFGATKALNFANLDDAEGTVAPNPMDSSPQSPPSDQVLGSTQKLAAIKATKQQQEELGAAVVSTPVRRSCRKERPQEDPSETSMLASTGFAFAPNKFILPDDAEEGDSDEAQSEGTDFAFDTAVPGSQGTNQSTPTFQLGTSEEGDAGFVMVDQELSLQVNTPNFPKLVRQKPAITPRTAIAKVLATLLNNTLKEGLEAKTSARAAKTPAWKSPGRTKTRLFSIQEKEEAEAAAEAGAAGGEAKSIARSLAFAREIDENQGSIDHNVDLASVPSQVLSVDDCTENTLPEQQMDDPATFHSGLTPVAMPPKSPVKEMIQKYEDVIGGSAVKAPAPAPAESETQADAEAAPKEPSKRRKSILKKAEAQNEAPAAVAEEKKEEEGGRLTRRKKSVRFSGEGIPVPEVQVEEKPQKWATRSSQRKAKEEAPAPAPSDAPVRRSRRVATTTTGDAKAPKAKAKAASASAPKAKVGGAYTEDVVLSWRVVDLKEALKKAGLPTSGLKKDLQKWALDNLL